MRERKKKHAARLAATAPLMMAGAAGTVRAATTTYNFNDLTLDG